MKDLIEVRQIIDELDDRIKSYGDKAVWMKSSQTDWFTFIVEKGPKIVDSWRELSALIQLTPGDQLIALQNRLDMFQQMAANPEVMELAIRLNRKVVPPKTDE
jgi:hypothetical protein